MPASASVTLHAQGGAPAPSRSSWRACGCPDQAMETNRAIPSKYGNLGCRLFRSPGFLLPSDALFSNRRFLQPATALIPTVRSFTVPNLPVSGCACRFRSLRTRSSGPKSSLFQLVAALSAEQIIRRNRRVAIRANVHDFHRFFLIRFCRNRIGLRSQMISAIGTKPGLRHDR